MAFSLKLSLAAAALTLAALPAKAAELVMVEQPGCMYCAEWTAVIGPIYPKTPEGDFAPLRVVQKSALGDGDLSLARPVIYTPTFVLVEENTEIGRLEGYPGEDFFWAMLKLMLVAKTDYEPSDAPAG